MVLQLLRASCWYCDNCITKLWAHCSYYLYLYMVFCQHCFHSEQHFFPVLRTFHTDWVLAGPQSSLVIHNYWSIDYSCIMSALIISVIWYHVTSLRELIRIKLFLHWYLSDWCKPHKINISWMLGQWQHQK